jgi:hypothetical protein
MRSGLGASGGLATLGIAFCFSSFSFSFSLASSSAFSKALRAAGRTQAVGSCLGDVFFVGLVGFLGGELLLRQCESLTTRFLGAVATSTSSSRGLWAGGGFFELFGRSGVASADLGGATAGFGLGLSWGAFSCGVEGGLGDGGGLDCAGSEATSGAASGSALRSTCHFLILSFTLAGLSIPIALPKSAPFIVVLRVQSWAGTWSCGRGGLMGALERAWWAGVGFCRGHGAQSAGAW